MFMCYEKELPFHLAPDPQHRVGWYRRDGHFGLVDGWSEGTMGYFE
jgi:hypothetical protein